METTIRHAALDDLQPVVELFEAYRLFYAGAPDETAARNFIRKRLQEKDSAIFLAERSGRVAGFMQLYPGFTSLGMARTWILNDLFVDQEHRRLGVASRLLTRAADFAKETGARKIILSTAVTNLAAQALYERHDWKRDTEFYAYALQAPA